MAKEVGKKSRTLPTRGGLNDLGKSKRTITDYSKASPMNPIEPNPAEVKILELPKKRR